jgi:hypothetical protein
VPATREATPTTHFCSFLPDGTGVRLTSETHTNNRGQSMVGMLQFDPKYGKSTMRAIAILLAVATSTASAAPLSLTWQGRLLDSLGAPVNGNQTLTVDLFGDVNAVTPDWTDDFSEDVDGGFFSVQIGSNTPLPTDLFSGGDVWIQVSTAAGALSGRQHLTSVPFSLVSAGITVDSITPNPFTCDTAGATVYDSAAAGVRVCDGADWKWVRSETCGPTGTAGLTRWSGTALQVCNGTSWTDVNQPSSGSILFTNFEYDSTNRTFGGSWAVGKTWTQHTIAGDTLLQVQAHVPQRNDTSGWGGCYTEFQVSINSGTWSSLGDSGYENMDSSGAAIQSSHFSFMVDPGQASQYTAQFRWRHHSYGGTCLINQSHGISITGVGVGWSNMMVTAIKK